MPVVETHFDIGDMEDMIDASGAGRGKDPTSSIGGAAGEDEESHTRQVLDAIQTDIEADGDTTIPELAGQLALQGMERYDSAAVHAAEVAQFGVPFSLENLAERYGASAIYGS